MVKVSAGAAANQFKRVGNYIAPQVNKGADRVAANARQQKQINATRENQEDQQLEKRLSDTKVEDDDFLIDATGITDEDDFNRLAAKNGISSNSLCASNAFAVKIVTGLACCASFARNKASLEPSKPEKRELVPGKGKVNFCCIFKQLTLRC